MPTRLPRRSSTLVTPSFQACSDTIKGEGERPSSGIRAMVATIVTVEPRLMELKSPAPQVAAPASELPDAISWMVSAVPDLGASSTSTPNSSK